MTRHQPLLSRATIHVDHRMARVDVRRQREGYAFVWFVADAGASDKGFEGRALRRAWDHGQWKELSEERLGERLEGPETVTTDRLGESR